jgi:GNAT superfamily N-acetyltransferase
MKIRFAQRADIPKLLEIGKAMVGESRFKCYGLNEQKATAAVEGMLCNPGTPCLLVASRSDGEIVGMLAGQAMEFFFGDGILVQDRWLYVLRAYRGSAAAVKLLMAFRKWAESRNADELCINMSVAIDMGRFNKLMTHMGFKNLSVLATGFEVDDRATVDPESPAHANHRDSLAIARGAKRRAFVFDQLRSRPLARCQERTPRLPRRLASSQPSQSRARSSLRRCSMARSNLHSLRARNIPDAAR